MQKVQIKIIGMAFICAFLLLTPINVVASERNLYSEWKSESLVYPDAGQVVPAGPICIQWKALQLEDINIKQYNVYLDDDKPIVVVSNDDQLNIEIYVTEVSSHRLRITAVLENGSEINTNQRIFYVSKKGIAYNDIDNIQNLDASWYYNWGITPSSIKNQLDFVPMIWGATDQEIQNIQIVKENGYSQILGFNEPEGSKNGQSNVSIDRAISITKDFAESGLRVGSPAVEHLSDITKEEGWFDQYMDKINTDDIDFITTHEYIYNVCGDATKNQAIDFLKNLQSVYDKYNKPIWITELSVINWDQYWLHYSYDNEEGRKEVNQFMDYIINGVDAYKGMDELEYVERYAWFPFDRTSPQAGASSLFVTETDNHTNASLTLGVLTELGQKYKLFGLPKDFLTGQDILDVYVEDKLMDQKIIYQVSVDGIVYKVEEGSIFVKPRITLRDDCQFLGWYTEQEFVHLFDFDKPIIGHINLYSKWKKIDSNIEIRKLDKEAVITGDNQDQKIYILFMFLSGCLFIISLKKSVK